MLLWSGSVASLSGVKLEMLLYLRKCKITKRQIHTNYIFVSAGRDVTRQKNGVDERGVHPCFNIVSLFEEIGHRFFLCVVKFCCFLGAVNRDDPKSAWRNRKLLIFWSFSASWFAYFDHRSAIDGRIFVSC